MHRQGAVSHTWPLPQSLSPVQAVPTMQMPGHWVAPGGRQMAPLQSWLLWQVSAGQEAGQAQTPLLGLPQPTKYDPPLQSGQVSTVQPAPFDAAIWQVCSSRPAQLQKSGGQGSASQVGAVLLASEQPVNEGVHWHWSQ